MGRFLGFTGYYRQFIKNFAVISTIFHVLAPSNKRFNWIEQMKAVFEVLKDKFKSLHVLALSDFELPFVVEMYA